MDGIPQTCTPGFFLIRIRILATRHYLSLSVPSSLHFECLVAFPQSVADRASDHITSMAHCGLLMQLWLHLRAK